MRVLVLILILCTWGCKENKRYHDSQQGKTDVVYTGGLADAYAFHEKLNRDFKDPEISPLPDRYRKNFEGLDFFAPDSNYLIKAKFTRILAPLPFFMSTSTGGRTEEIVYGKVSFSFNGKEHELEVYQNLELRKQKEYENYLFLPFSDRTNGEETYGAGRYLDLTIPEGDTILLDFNKAYNPYCAYNAKYSCPLVPEQNRLDTEIRAGVKAFNK